MTAPRSALVSLEDTPWYSACLLPQGRGGQAANHRIKEPRISKGYRARV